MGARRERTFMEGMLTLLLVTTLFAQPPDTMWTKTYGGSGDDRGYFLQETSDGGYIIVGSTTSFGEGGYDVYLVKTDEDGDALWTKTYGGTGSDVGYSVQETSGGGYIIAARTTSFGAGSGDMYLIKTNANGDTLWTKTYGGEYDEGAGLVQETPDGGYIMVGYTKSFSVAFGDVYLLKTDSAGDTLWTKTYGGIGEDWGVSVKQTPDDGYIIAGITWSFGAGGWDAYLLRTNAWGDTLWTKTYGGPESEYALSIQETFDYGYIIAGWIEPFESGDVYDVYLVKIDSDGGLLWEKTFGTEDLDYGHSVCVAPDGGYIVAGCTYSVGEGDLYLVKTDSNGNTLWTKTYGGTDEDWGVTISGTSDDGYIITGGTASFGAGDVDVWLVKTEPDTGVGISEPPIVEGSSFEVSTALNRLAYNLPGQAQLSVYSADGRKALTETIEGRGVWEAPKTIAKGVYFVQINSGGYSIRNKLIVLR
jgi:hypothetical protein